MKRFVVGTMAAVVLASSAQMAMAQSKTVRSEMRTDTATVEAVEASTRTLTLKKADGSYLTTVAGPDIIRFSEVKIGDTVNVAARTEELTKSVGAPILVSEETRRRVGDAIAFTAAEPVRVRGRTQPLQSYVPRAVAAFSG